MDRSIGPAFSSTLDFTLPTPQKIQLGHAPGSALVLLTYTQTPITKIEFVFLAGKAVEPSPGVSQFTANLLDKGVPGKSAKDIVSTFDYYGAHVELSADADYATISVYSLAKHVNQLLPLVLDLITVPTFPGEELEKYRAVFMENLKVNQQKNSYLATVALRKAMFAGHAYANTVELEDAQNIKESVLKAFFNQHYAPFKIFVTGELGDAELKMLSDYFGKKPNIDSSISHPTKPDHQPRVKTLGGPGKDQASIRFGKHTLTRTHEAMGNLILLNHVLGGFFGSRLMHNIREEKGLTYGIYSSIQHLNQVSTMTIAAEVNLENVEQAITEINKELSALAQPMPPDELQKAKNHLIGSIQNDSASIFAISERVKDLELNSLDAAYYTELIHKIATATPEDLAVLASHYLTPDSFSVITVGG